MTTAATAPRMPDAPTMAQGAEAWSHLTSLLTERARLDAQIVESVGELQRTGTIETIEGLTFDTALARTQRMPQAERSMLLTAADVLRHMPATRHLFNTGVLSWGQVRGIVAEARRLSGDERGWVDDRIGASADRLAKYDPDDLIDQVRVTVNEARGARAVERSEAAQARGNFLWAQPGMDERGKLYAELDNLSLAKVINRMDEAAPPDDGRSVAQRRADGLVNLADHACADELPAADAAGAEEHCDAGADDRSAAATGGRDSSPAGGNDAQPRRNRHPRLGKPAYDVVVNLDMRDVTVTAAGTIEINAPGCLPTISAALLESIAADATVRAVICDGAQPLTVTKKVRAKQIPDDVRAAVRARDRRDRFPESRRPIRPVHHLNKDDLGHHIDYLVGLADVSHQRVHRFGWRISLDPATGEVTFTRGERSWTTLPRGTPIRRLPPPD